MHIAMSSVIHLDNFIHPMVLYVNCLYLNLYALTYKMKESHIKTIYCGREAGNKTPLGHFLMYVNLLSGVALMTKILS